MRNPSFSQEFKKRAYAWQSANPWGVGAGTLRNKTRDSMTISAALYYKIVPPKYKMRSRGNVSEYIGSTHTIELVTFHQNPILVLHETAHAIAVKRFGWFGHNKRWLGIWQWLLLKEKIMQKKFLKASMSAYDLPWCPLSPRDLGVR